MVKYIEMSPHYSRRGLVDKNLVPNLEMPGIRVRARHVWHVIV